MNEEFEKFPIWKFVLFGLGVVVSVSMTLTTWLFTKVTDVNDRLIAIENSRCTSEHCSVTAATVSNLKDRIEKMPGEIPPQWFRDKVSSNTQRIAILERESRLIEELKKKGES